MIFEKNPFTTAVSIPKSFHLTPPSPTLKNIDQPYCDIVNQSPTIVLMVMYRASEKKMQCLDILPHFHGTTIRSRYTSVLYDFSSYTDFLY